MEAIAYAHSPLAEYLRETGVEGEQGLLQEEEVGYDQAVENEEITAGHELQDRESNGPVLIPLPPTPSTSAIPSAPNSKHDYFTDRLKYSLVTSSLLTPRLVDALPLYPARPAKIRRVDATRKGPRLPLEWGTGWEKKGNGWEDRSTFETVWGLLFWILVGVYRRIYPAQQVMIIGTEGEVKQPEDLPLSMHDIVLQTVDGLVESMQELDLRIARALVGVREVETIGSELPCSDQSYLASSQSRRRPLSLSAPSRKPRSIPLRSFLSSSLAGLTSTITASFSTLGTGPLNGLNPAEFAPEPAPHSALAAPGLPSPLLLSTADKRKTWDGSNASLNFGGIDRSSFLSSPARTRPSQQSPSSPKTIWESPPSSPSPKGIAAAKRPRPTSLNVWSNSNGSTTLTNGGISRGSSLKRTARYPNQEESLLKRSSSRRSTTSSRSHREVEEVEESIDELSIEGIQISFEEMHSLRQRFLWRVLSLTDENLTEEEWLEVQAVLSTLTETIKTASKCVSLAVEKEFGEEGVGSETFLVNSGRSNRLSMALSASDISPSLSSTAYFPSSSSSRPTSIQSRAQLSSNTSQSLSTAYRNERIPSPLLASVTNFAPVNPEYIDRPTAALQSFEIHTMNMTTSLRTLATKLHIVSEDLRSLSIRDEAGSREGKSLLEIHDSLRFELETLGREWETSRMDLRMVLGKNVASNTSKESQTEEEKKIVDEEPEKKLPVTPPTTYVDLPSDPPLALESHIDSISSSYLPPMGQPQIYEATVPSAPSLAPSSTLSRDERIRLAKSERRKGSVVGPAGGGGGVMGLQKGMVTELKDVLELLKGRHKLETD